VRLFFLLTWFALLFFILLIELEQDINIRTRIGYILKKWSHRMVRIKLVSISELRFSCILNKSHIYQIEFRILYQKTYNAKDYVVYLRLL
jgi:hypothetical protein